MSPDPFETETSGVEGTPDAADTLTEPLEESPGDVSEDDHATPARGMAPVPEYSPPGLIEVPSLALQAWLEAKPWRVFLILIPIIVIFLLIVMF